MGKRIDDTTGGNSGVEPRLGVMYTEMVVRRGYSLPRYVDLVSTNAAKIMGLYPRKGAIAAGSDADITILDPTRRGKVRNEDLHETDYTPWEGHDIFAWPVVTMLRGKVVVENGKFLGARGRRANISSARSRPRSSPGRRCERRQCADRRARAAGAEPAQPGAIAGEVRREADGAHRADGRRHSRAASSRARPRACRSAGW